MRIDTIERSLFPLFSDDSPIVFWDDEQGEFSEILPQLPLEAHGVTLIRRDEIGDLELKVMLELEKTGQRFLLYSPQVAPPPQEDWLLNIRLYSRTFSADTATILLGELGLEATALRSHLTLRKKFFASQERTARLKRHITPHAGERELDMGMLAVLVRAEQADLDEILIRLFLEQYPEDQPVMAEEAAPLWKEVEKYGLVQAFKLLVKNKTMRACRMRTARRCFPCGTCSAACWSRTWPTAWGKSCPPRWRIFVWKARWPVWHLFFAITGAGTAPGTDGWPVSPALSPRN